MTAKLPAERIAAYLTHRGFVCDIGYSTDPQCEDDEVRIDGNLSVQVNALTLTVCASVCTERNGTFRLWPERSRMADIASDLRSAQASL